MQESCIFDRTGYLYGADHGPDPPTTTASSGGTPRWERSISVIGASAMPAQATYSPLGPDAGWRV